MNDSISMLCDSFVENKAVLKSYFGREDVTVYPVCAAMFTDRQKAATEENLESCRELLKTAESPSEFRAAAIVPVIALLAADENPTEKLQRSVALFSALRNYFTGSPYLALTTMFASDMLDESEYSEAAERASRIGKIIDKKKILDADDDLSMPSTLLAIADMKNGSDENQNAAVWNAEVILSTLEEDFFMDDALQAQSLVLAMSGGDPKTLAERDVEFYNSLETKNYRLGASYAYGIFAFLSMFPDDISSINKKLFQTDSYLVNQKGYSGVFGTNKRTRLLHSAYITSIAGVYKHHQLWDAQQAAMCLAMASAATNL